MNEITKHNPRAVSTETNDDYMLIFNDDSTKRITKAQAEALMQASGTQAKFITIDGGMINFSNIARCIPIREYWDQFPDERPVYDNYDIKEPMYNTGVGYKKRLYSSEKMLREALLVWKRQRSSPDYVRVTGGLDKLIADGEARLLKLIREKRKELTLEAGISLSSKDEKINRLFGTPRPVAVQDSREDRLRKIRERRDRENPQIQSIGEI